MIPIVLVSGFLGAGKTTLMKRLLRDAHARGLKTCVIVNEFGVADVDSSILKEADAELLSSVAGGCACCSGQEEFLWTLLDVAERSGETRPEVILVECSGLADPVLMLDSITVARLLPLVRLGALISVVDRGRFLLVRDEAAPLLIRQLQLADIVVLNKIDIAFSAQERARPMAELVEQLQQIAPRAHIEPARGCDIGFAPLWQRVFNQKNAASQTGTEERAPEAPHAHFQTVVCPVPHPIERARMEASLKALPPEVWRAKGFVRLRGEAGLQLVQLTSTRNGPHFEVRPFATFEIASDEPPTALVFIGPSLDRAALLKEFSGSTLLPMI
jgi:G3E family GTPase